MSKLAMIGGTGVTRLKNFRMTDQKTVDTPWGAPSAPLSYGSMNDAEVIFLPRHGSDHSIVPHNINYRANLWALKEAGVECIMAIAAVGGITAEMKPAVIAIPDQIIDYTWGRVSTFFEDPGTEVRHIDFSWPYSEALRQQLIQAAQQANIAAISHGVYGCTQGPRLETAAEIRRMEQDGCHLVGMTGMPEAALARELDIDYACCAIVANYAAGKTDQEISLDDIKQNMAAGVTALAKLLRNINIS